MRPSGLSILLFLSAINLINFVDRGIISGAPVQLEAFIRNTLGCEPEHTPVWLGVLQSSFIACYSVACLIFSQLRLSMPPFRLLGIGLCIWAGALALSAVPYWLPRTPSAFWLFLCARALSGVGEAAFQCIVPPYIEDFSPAARKTLWLAIFYTAIPTGTALGYVYGSIVAAAAGWGYAYLIEALLMAPTVLLVFFLPPASALVGESAAPLPSCASGSGSGSGAGAGGGATASLLAEQHGGAEAPPPPLAAAAAVQGGGGGAASEGAVRLLPPAEEAAVAKPGELQGLGSHPSMVTQIWWLLRCPPFVLIVLGYAAYTATVIGISSFGPLFLIGLGTFPTEVAASTSFGITVALGGLLGAPIGGLTVDVVTRRSAAAELARRPDGGGYSGVKEARDLMLVLTWQITLGSLVLLASASTTIDPALCPLFLTLLGIGIFLVFGTSAGTTRAIMLLVPPHIRSFAIALQTLGLHLFGDVPSPIVIGALQAALAPSCNNHWSNATTRWGPSCRTTPEDDEPVFCCDRKQDVDGLYATLLIAVLWMAWSGVLWFACFLLLRQRARRADDHVGESGSSCIN